MQDSLVVTIDPPRNGWLPINVVAAEQRVCFAASYTPDDSFTKLIWSVNVFGAGIDPDSVVFNEEPSQIELTLRHLGDDSELMLFRYKNDKRSKGAHVQPIFVYRDRARAICLAFCRAIRQLEMDISREGFESAWGYPFPSRSVDDLAILVDKLRNT